MKLVGFLVWLLAVAGPIAGYLAVLPRSERRHGKLRVVLGTLALGAILYVPAAVVERLLESWTSLDVRPGSASNLTMLAYTFLVAAPLEQGLKVAAVTPVWRSRHFHAAFDGVVYASAAALGAISAHNALFLWRSALSFDLCRALCAVPAHLFFAAVWGYALARDPKKRLGGRLFNVCWLLAMGFNGAFDHIVFHRGKAALIAVLPVLICMAGVAALARRDLLQRGAAPSSAFHSRRLSIAPPSLGAMREALLRTERPVMLTWIAFGALVTTGVMTATLAAAVLAGHRFGVDFSAVDRAGETSMAGAVPLMLLGGAALMAFPIAGFLVARASSTRTVLEPAMSAGLAIAGSLVLLGLAAPIAVVFAIAFAPIAFGLACAGAWVGLGR